MTSSELISELARVQHLFEWKIEPDTGYGSELRSQSRLWIRGTGREGPEGVVFEPIGAVCYIRTANVYPDTMWMEAAEALGLSHSDARDLVYASNETTWHTVPGGWREPDPRLQSLRKEMVVAVGLDAQP